MIDSCIHLGDVLSIVFEIFDATNYYDANCQKKNLQIFTSVCCCQKIKMSKNRVF